jgi:hypothetical protein
MKRENLIPDRDTECRVLALLQCTHAMVMETDRLAGIIAEELGIDPMSDVITEAVFNAQDPATALMFLRGDLPTAGRAHA